MYVKKVMKLDAFVFEHPSNINKIWFYQKYYRNEKMFHPAWSPQPLIVKKTICVFDIDLCFLSIFAIISPRKRELIALLIIFLLISMCAIDCLCSILSSSSRHWTSVDSVYESKSCL